MRKRIKVLIADDSPLSRGGLWAVLATCSELEVVMEATDGLEAVELAKRICPDVVVMDVQMPVMDGLKATRLIKSSCRDIKVVLLTMDVERKADALDSGADAVVIKGCRIEELLQTILQRGKSMHPGRYEQEGEEER